MKKSENGLLELLLGIVLVALGIYILLENTIVYSFGFWRLRGIDTGAILIALLIISVICMVVKPNFVTKLFVGIFFAMLVASLILGMHFSLRGMTGMQALLIVGMIAVGIGFVIRAIFVVGGNNRGNGDGGGRGRRRSRKEKPDRERDAERIQREAEDELARLREKVEASGAIGRK